MIGAVRVVCCSLLACGSVSADGRDPGRVDLLAGYWRYHLTFAPARVAPKILARDVAANADGLGRFFQRRRLSVEKPYLGHPFYYRYHYSGHGGSSDLTYLLRSDPPPDRWPRPDFDDSTWPRQRRPFLAGGASSAIGLGVARASFRARFTVSDPARIRRLRLDVTYRGGVVVYVNGHEVGRGHLPAGGLGPETPGRAYPIEAYALPPTDVGPAGDRGRPIPELGGEFPGPTPLIKDQLKANPRAYRLPAKDLTTYYRQGSGHVLVTRREFAQVKRLRDRKLHVLVPARLLRKGTNLVAVEVRRSDLHPVVLGGSRLGTRQWGYFGGFIWMHGALLGIALEGEPAGAVAAEQRPAGLQIWPADIHRRHFSSEFGPRAERPAPVRIVGARNGVFSGQAVLGTSLPLKTLDVKMGDLQGPAGRKIPASAVRVRYGRGRPVAELAALGTDRGAPRWRKPDKSVQVRLAVLRHARAPAGGAGAASAADLQFFDQLTRRPPADVPADSCLPVWITVAVPKSAAPGRYDATLTVAAGGREVSMPVRLHVVDWPLPDPARFETVMALEQSPYGVARQYRAPLWGDRHFRLLERSLARLGEIGNDYLVVPVLTGSEFGNGQDAMVRWIRRAGPGAPGYACDFSIVERYLDAALKHFRPRCVCFVLSHATDNNLFVKPRVVLSRQGGDLSLMDVPRPGTDEARRLWRPFVDGLTKRMAARGLAPATHWGYLWDTMDHRRTGGYVSGMMKMLAELAPGVGWARGAHRAGKGVKGPNPFTFVASIYSLPYPLKRKPHLAVFSHKGWKNPRMHLVLPRVVNTVVTVEGPSPPFSYRLAPERSLIAGGRGLARIGADYWADAYHAGWRGGVQVGMPITAVLWPGPEGAEGSARFEALREGIQETEARIFLERALEGSLAPAPAAKQAQAVLDRRIAETLYVPPGYPAPGVAEYCGGWQERSWDLYAAAARVAGGAAPSGREKGEFFGGP